MDKLRYFVKIEAPDRRALVSLNKMGLDLFGHTSVAATATLRKAEQPPNFTIDGLLDMEQVERVVRAGYRVTVEEESSKRAIGATNVIEFQQWLKEMGE